MCHNNLLKFTKRVGGFLWIDAWQSTGAREMPLHPAFEDKSTYGSIHLPNWRRHWADTSPSLLLYSAGKSSLWFCHPPSRHLPLETSKTQYALVTQSRNVSHASSDILTFPFFFPTSRIRGHSSNTDYCSSEDIFFLRLPLIEKSITLRAAKIRFLKITALLRKHLMSTMWGCGKWKDAILM